MPALDLSVAAIGIGLLAKPATRRRYTPAGWTDGGKYDEAAGRVNTTISAVIQPFNASSTAENKMDLRSLGGGEHVEDYVVIWTRDDLRLSDEATAVPADEVEAPDGRVFKILSLSRRAEAGFNRAIAGLIYDRGRGL